jgi:hypothetical protein
MTKPPGIPEFAESLAKLEAQIAAADALGNAVPPEARQMAAKLRELVDALGALGALTSTLQPAPPDAPGA